MISLNIPKIRCGGCVASVEKAVLSVDPAARITADVPARFMTFVGADPA